MIATFHKENMERTPVPMHHLSLKSADYTPCFKEIKGGSPMMGMTKVNIIDVHDQQVVVQNNM